MHLRSLVLMGLCAALGVATPALAETASSSKTYLFSSAKQADDAAPKAETAGPKKKLTAKEKAKAKKEAAAKTKAGGKAKPEDKLAKAKEEKLAKAKEAAEAKAEAKQKLQARIDAKIAKARADAKLAAKAKADAQAEKLAKAKADAKIAAEAREEARAAARTKAAEAAKAKRDRRLARVEPLRPVEDVEIEPIDVALAGNIAVTGNNGELRSEVQKQEVNQGFFQALFGGKQASRSRLLPETRALDAALQAKQARKQFKVKPEFEPQEVAFSGYAPGTIVIDTSERRLYLVQSFGSARRYAIAVGREGLQYKGTVAVGDKQEWPRWIPTLDMQKREPKHYGQYKDGMPGGGENPLGARAIYLYEGKKDTHLRIHGTIAPQTIGTSASNGCFRMINEHVMDLYSRVKVGTKVVII